MPQVLQEGVGEGEGAWVGVARQSSPEEVPLSQVLRHEGPPIVGKAEEWHSRQATTQVEVWGPG